MIARHSKGFTLIEILTSIGIIVLLLGVIVSSISSARQSSRDGKRVADINLLRLALEQYYDACGQYPNVSPLNRTVNTGCSGSTTFGSFIAEIPKDPGTGANYYYYASGTGTKCTRYHIGATLESSTHRALNDDADLTSSPPGTVCNGASWVSGADPVYDGTQSK